MKTESTVLELEKDERFTIQVKDGDTGIWAQFSGCTATRSGSGEVGYRTPEGLVFWSWLGPESMTIEPE
jgi:hypothetical protein